MTRRIPPRSAVAAADSGLARLAIVDLDASSVDGVGIAPSLSLRDLARSLVPVSILSDVPERAAIGDWLRGLARRSG